MILLTKLPLMMLACLVVSQALALVQIESELKGKTCGDKAVTLLKEWKAENHWVGQFSDKESEKIYRAPTATFGKWVQIKIDGKNIELIQFSANESLITKFDSKCAPVAELKTSEPGKPAPAKKGEFKVLRDPEIEKIMASKKSAVLFLWSPQMPISIEALKEILLANKKLKTDFYLTVPSAASPASVKNVAKTLKVPMNKIYYIESFDLGLRGFQLHYPSLVVINKGVIASPVRRGHETSEIYIDFLKTYL